MKKYLEANVWQIVIRNRQWAVMGSQKGEDCVDSSWVRKDAGVSSGGADSKEAWQAGCCLTGWWAKGNLWRKSFSRVLVPKHQLVTMEQTLGGRKGFLAPSLEGT